jgi:hypothetical protein
MAKKAKPIKNPAAVALGRLGGLKGGPARTASMTPAQRKAGCIWVNLMADDVMIGHNDLCE